MGDGNGDGDGDGNFHITTGNVEEKDNELGQRRVRNLEGKWTTQK